MFGTHPPRHPYTIGFDWTADPDEFGIAAHDPAKVASMTRQCLRRLHGCADLAEIDAAWNAAGRICAALRDGGHHPQADDILDTYERLRRRMDAEDAPEPEFSDGNDAEADRERP